MRKYLILDGSLSLCFEESNFYGNTMYKLHPQDADSIKMVQFLFGHSSEDITKGYIEAIDEKIDQLICVKYYRKHTYRGKRIQVEKMILRL